MSTYKYFPYYEYNGPTVSSPLKEKLSKDDQERNIELFYTDVFNNFEDDGAIVSRDSDGLVSIQTGLAKKECDDRIAGILNSLDLFARKA